MTAPHHVLPVPTVEDVVELKRQITIARTPTTTTPDAVTLARLHDLVTGYVWAYDAFMNKGTHMDLEKAREFLAALRGVTNVEHNVPTINDLTGALQ